MGTKPNLSFWGLNSECSFDYENGFILFSSPKRLAKMLAHYEIYKKVVNLPGCVIEFGVHKGNSLLQICTFRKMLEMDEARIVYAFDTFENFPIDGVENIEDLSFIEKFTNEAGLPIHDEELRSVCELKGFSNVFLIKGDVRLTFPEFLESHPAVKFNLIHFDMDVYEPTANSLPMAWERLVKGGVLMIDDYSTVYGATKAIDEFIVQLTPSVKINKLPFSHIPAYIIKP